MELGGERSISTGNTFCHTKLFYGGKRHRITPRSFLPKLKKVFFFFFSQLKWNEVV